MDLIPLNTVRAAVADVAADTAGTVVAAPVVDIAGAATDAWAALAGAAADTAVAAADARAALAGAAADTTDNAAAATDSAGDLYGHACRVRYNFSRHASRSARSGRRFSLCSERPGHGCRRSCPSLC